MSSQRFWIARVVLCGVMGLVMVYLGAAGILSGNISILAVCGWMWLAVAFTPKGGRRHD
jgi:hypothetical protein